MQWVIETIRREWGVISQAPVNFIVALAALSTLAFLIARLLKAQEISDLKGRVALREDELASCQRKLQASPEESRASLVQVEVQRLSAHRQLAWIAARFVVQAMNQALVGNWHDPDSFDFKTCRDALRAVPLSDVEPASLIVHFVEIAHMTDAAEAIVLKRSAESGKIVMIRDRAQNALHQIDEYLRERQPA